MAKKTFRGLVPAGKDLYSGLRNRAMLGWEYYMRGVPGAVDEARRQLAAGESPIFPPIAYARGNQRPNQYAPIRLAPPREMFRNTNLPMYDFTRLSPAREQSRLPAGAYGAAGPNGVIIQPNQRPGMVDTLEQYQMMRNAMRGQFMNIPGENVRVGLNPQPNMVGAEQMTWDEASGRYVPLTPGQRPVSRDFTGAGNPEENRAKYMRDLENMRQLAMTTPTTRNMTITRNERQEDRTSQNAAMVRVAGQPVQPSPEQEAAAKVQEALFENQQKLGLFVAQEQVRADFASAQQDAQFKTTVEQPMAQYLEDKYGEQWNAIVENNPAAGPAMRIAFVSTLRRAQLKGESNLEKIADDWAKEWLIGPWYGKAKGTKLS